MENFMKPTRLKRGGDILIIDDTPDNLEVLTEMMTKRGYQTRTRTTAQSGWNAAHEALPDLILLDVGLPDIDGFTLCRRFKDDPLFADVPIIFISAFNDVENKVKGFKAGAVDYIPKPFHHNEVIARVQSQLALKHLRQQEQELAVLRERQRIARDLHDAVSQTLFSAGLMLDKLIMRGGHDPFTEQTLLRLTELSRSAAAEMRTILYELRPEALANADLADLLTNLADIVSARTQAEVETRLDSLTLPDEAQIAVYRIAQEAVNNLIKHAQPSSVLIELINAPDAVTLTIADDGAGFDPAHSGAGRFGLANMLERAERVGAALHIDSEPGQGTVIRLRLESVWEMA
jgi:two-component system sensor histidine kinase/response regulator